MPHSLPALHTLSTYYPHPTHHLHYSTDHSVAMAHSSPTLHTLIIHYQCPTPHPHYTVHLHPTTLTASSLSMIHPHLTRYPHYTDHLFGDSVTSHTLPTLHSLITHIPLPTDTTLTHHWFSDSAHPSPYRHYTH